MGVWDWRLRLARLLLPPSASGLTHRDAAIGLGERACRKERERRSWRMFTAHDHMGSCHDNVAAKLVMRSYYSCA